MVPDVVVVSESVFLVLVNKKLLGFSVRICIEREDHGVVSRKVAKDEEIVLRANARDIARRALLEKVGETITVMAVSLVSVYAETAIW